MPFWKAVQRTMQFSRVLITVEWCEPGTNPMMSMQNGNFDVATAYFAHSGETLSEIAAILGKEEDAAHYREVSENAKKAFEEIFTKDGVVESERQCPVHPSDSVWPCE